MIVFFMHLSESLTRVLYLSGLENAHKQRFKEIITLLHSKNLFSFKELKYTYPYFDLDGFHSIKKEKISVIISKIHHILIKLKKNEELMKEIREINTNSTIL